VTAGRPARWRTLVVAVSAVGSVGCAEISGDRALDEPDDVISPENAVNEPVTVTYETSDAQRSGTAVIEVRVDVGDRRLMKLVPLDEGCTVGPVHDKEGPSSPPSATAA